MCTKPLQNQKTIKENQRPRAEKNIKLHLLSLYYIYSIMDAKKSSSGAVETIDVHQAKDLLEDSGYTYIDVRTTEEFNKGHVDVKNILNIPYMFSTPEGRVTNPQFLEQVMFACKKEDKLIVGCQSGVRSLHASVVLLEAEFKHVKNMGGGYAAWVENGLPVKKAKSEL